MRAKARRKLEAAERALAFCEANPDEGDPGFKSGVVRLAGLIERARARTQVQREGIVKVRTATAMRHAKRQAIIGTHVAHLARVAELAAHEDRSVERWFTMGRAGRNQIGAFLTATRSMADRAEEKRELLVRHGLSPKVLDDFKRQLAALEALNADWNAGRAQHIGATAELQQLASEAGEVVRALDGFNRLRFVGDADRLSRWHFASTVQATPHHDHPKEQTPAPTPSTGAVVGDVRPAA